MNDDAKMKLSELLSNAKIGFLTTINESGKPESRPIGIPQKKFSGTVWLLTANDSDKVAQITANPPVNLAFHTDGAWVSLTGDATVAHDQSVIDELWMPIYKSFFTGPEDANIAVIAINVTSAEYWDEQGKMTNLIEMTKAAVTDKKPDLGENKTIDLT